ncbi:uncharacterized protein LOC132555701 [Ylistrum balloti]|uniref:uncharacterized protein LOC132555701 n=1 Tax=Ylistrum balloti TaxID=509963 RepID=UPI002905F4C4|nr:uncharacterized protein LOC132555701 [Ylistrum balloti]
METALHCVVLLLFLGVQTSRGEIWQMTIFIDTRINANSGDTLFLDVDGTLSSMREINLGNNFYRGEIRQLSINADFGEINSIRLYQTQNDGMRVRQAVLEDGNGRRYAFDCQCWIQNDQPADDSKPSWILTPQNCYWNDSIPYCTTVVRATCQIGKCEKCVDGYQLYTDGCKGKY